MKRGLYFRLAGEGILKNRKLYFPYILTCICMVMMFYIVTYLFMSADLKNVMGGDMLASLIGIGMWVIAIFSVIFLFYTNSFLIRRRQKEFGLYNILGMGKRNLVKILVWENVITAVVSIAAGLLFGILFSKLAELAAIRILHGNTGFSIHLDTKPMITAAVLFLAIFALIMVRMLVYIYRLKPVELLKSESMGEKPPKSNRVLALAGAVILAAAYYMAVALMDPMSAMLMFFFAVIMVIIATYLLFIAGSVVFCRILQSKKNYYYKTKHFVSVSSMMFRMKRNGAGLASICILSTMVLVTVSTTVCMYVQTENGVENRYPHDIAMELSSDDRSATEPYISETDSVLEEYGVQKENVEDFFLYSFTGFQAGDEVWLDAASYEQNGSAAEYDSARRIYIISLEDYNRISGENRTLAQDEALLYPVKMEYRHDTLTIENCGTWKVELLDSAPFSVGTAQANMEGSMFLVVNDMSTIQMIRDTRNAMAEAGSNMVTSSIERCYSFDLDTGDEEQIKIYNDILERFLQIGEEQELPEFYIDCKASGRSDYLALNGGLFFLGILLGAVFLFGTVLIMYYKQVSEGYEDQDRFDILMKVGMSRREVRKSINSQVLTVFFLPLVTAGVHLAFAFPLISKILLLMSATEEHVLIITTVCCYLVFAVFYVIVYAVTSKSYYTIVSGKDKK